MKHDSIQRKLGRIRAPRVQITYDVEIGDAAEKRQLPMVVGVISPLSGPQGQSWRSGDRHAAHGPQANTAGFERLTRLGLDGLMATIQPQLLLRLPSRLQPGQHTNVLTVQLRFSALHDFHPDAIVSQTPELAAMVKQRAQLLALRNRLAGHPGLQKCVRQHLGGLTVCKQDPLP
jgi:type VI secretion system protein ImpB